MNDGGIRIRVTSKQAPKQQHDATHEEYRKILSTANKLETIQEKLDSVIDLFATPVVSNLLSKLCNDCVNLLIKCQFRLVEFRKAEELVWRRAYHDVYRLLKTKRQLIKKQDEYLIESHFMSGIGYYSSLIVQLRLKYMVTDHVQGIIGPLNLALAPVEHLLDAGGRKAKARAGPNQTIPEETGTHDKSMSLEGEVKQMPDGKAARQWARQAIYRSLIYMGDLARYLLEFSESDHRKLAFELYRSATRYQPDQGLPYNQLATLAGNLNYNLDAVCNYMRCCLRPKPFERAEGNMIKLFEMNRKYHDEFAKEMPKIKASDVLASRDPTGKAEDLMKLGLVIQGTQKFFEILGEAIELEPIVPLASNSNLDMDFRPISGNTSSMEKPRYVSPTILFEFCSISIMLIARRQQKSTNLQAIPSTLNDNIATLVNTLALNLLHYATSKCQRMIISKIQDIRISRQQDSSIERSSLLKPSSEQNLRDSSPVSSDATSRRVISRLRQKEAAATYSGELNKSGRVIRPLDVNDSDLSELEETALSTIDALDISSDMSEGQEYKSDDLINLDSGSSVNSDCEEEGVKLGGSMNPIPLSRPALRPTRSQTYEQERRPNLTGQESCNSLPMPDLLTGDLVDMSFKTNPTLYQDASQHPSEFGSEFQIGASLVESTLTFVYNQTYLPTIKVLFDWLLSNGSLIDSNIGSFSSFQVDLLKTVEVLDELKQLIELHDVTSSGHSEVYGHTFSGPEWVQKFPLSCDFTFVNLSPMRLVHETNIDFEYERELDEPENGFITIQCVEAFSYALTIFLKNKTINSQD